MKPMVAAMTPGGTRVEFTCREDTNDDALIYGAMFEDEYKLRGRGPMSGWAIDVGAHVGAITVALLVDNPDLRVLAIEPIASNAALVLENAQRNKVADRVKVVTLAASAPGVANEDILTEFTNYDTSVIDEVYVWGSRFVGNLLRGSGHVDTVKAIDLEGAIALTGVENITLLKIDCEGCEYRFLDSPALTHVERIVGEFHDGDTYATLKSLLDPTHTITRREGGAIGLFEAVPL